MLTALYIDTLISDAQGLVTPVSGLICFKFELTQAFMHALVSCKNEKVPIYNEGVRVVTIILPFLSNPLRFI